MKKIGLVMVLFCALLFMTGCKNNNTVNGSEENTKDSGNNSGNTIFDKMIPGEKLEGQKALYNVTDVLKNDIYSIISVKAYKDKQLVFLYSMDNKYGVSLYDFDKKKITKSVSIDAELSENTGLGVTTMGACYLYDESAGLYVTVDIENEKAGVHKLDFKSDSMLVSEGANRIYFTKDNDVSVYQFIAETDNVSEIYNAGDRFGYVYLKEILENDNVLLVKVREKDDMKYAKINIENQEVTTLDNIRGDMFFTGSYYAIKNAVYDKSLGIYNEKKPRVFSQFTLDEEEELDNIRFINNAPYFFTLVTNDILKKTTLRFYDIESGIMVNKAAYDSEYELIDYSFMYGDKNLCLEMKYNNSKVFIVFDTEAVEDVMK